MPRPLTIDFLVEDAVYRLTLTRRSARLETPPATIQPQVQCNWRTFQSLLTSNLRLPEAIGCGELRTSHDSVTRQLAALFPSKLLWRSPFALLRL